MCDRVRLDQLLPHGTAIRVVLGLAREKQPTACLQEVVFQLPIPGDSLIVRSDFGLLPGEICSSCESDQFSGSPC